MQIMLNEHNLLNLTELYGEDAAEIQHMKCDDTGSIHSPTLASGAEGITTAKLRALGHAMVAFADSTEAAAKAAREDI